MRCKSVLGMALAHCYALEHCDGKQFVGLTTRLHRTTHLYRWMPETTTLCVCSVCDVGMVGSLEVTPKNHRLKVSGKYTLPHKIIAHSRDMSWH